MKSRTHQTQKSRHVEYNRLSNRVTFIAIVTTTATPGDAERLRLCVMLGYVFTPLGVVSRSKFMIKIDKSQDEFS